MSPPRSTPGTADEFVTAELVSGPSSAASVASVARGIERKYLRPQDLRRLQHAEFTTRRPVRGIFSGKHASPLRGQSVEFRDYRDYVPGDDLHALDWKVYGRSNKLYVKLFEHQADLTVHLLVDASASMAFRGDPAVGLSKYDQACFLAAAIAFVIVKQGDRVSLTVTRQGDQQFHRAGNTMRHLASQLYALETTYPARTAQLPDAIQQLTRASRRRDVLIVISDFWEDREGILQALSVFRQQGGEVILFHVLHDHELDLPKVDHGTFIDSETGEEVRINIADIRDSYQLQVEEFLGGWRRGSTSRGFDYHLLRTSQSYSAVLESYLLRRSTVK